MSADTQIVWLSKCEVNHHEWQSVQNSFQSSVESNWHLLWIAINLHCDWRLGKLVSLSKPMRSKPKTNHNLLAHNFTCLVPVATANSDWFITLFTSMVIGQSNCFDNKTQLKFNLPVIELMSDSDVKKVFLSYGFLDKLDNAVTTGYALSSWCWQQQTELLRGRSWGQTSDQLDIYQ